MLLMRRWAIPVIGVGLGLAACGPISPERAAQECEERARQTSGLTGQARMGVGSGGVTTGLDLGIVLSSDTLRGRDPVDVYDDCVRSKTGHSPIRPPRL